MLLFRSCLGFWSEGCFAGLGFEVQVLSVNLQVVLTKCDLVPDKKLIEAGLLWAR